MPPALILFIKNPIPGKTKTRLAATVGDEMALKMYSALTEWTREQAQGLGDEVTRYLYYSNEVIADDGWPESQFEKKLQKGNGLGERMERAFTECFGQGHEKVVVIGSDCPGVTTAYLRESFAALEAAEVVIGPAADGGYTLLGTTSLQVSFFRDMEWSTDRVYQQTLARAEAASLKFTRLATLVDVDHLEDWHSYGWTLPN